MKLDVNVRLHALCFEELFRKAEKALDAHPLLRGGERDGSYYPRLFVNRLDWGFEMTAKRKDSRKRATDIRGEGETPEEAVDDLLAKLDYWAEAMK